MPIYAYRCATCGHARDVLQKLSDPLLTLCPACGADAFRKQLTAAGFQLKGSGWYVTDFKGGAPAPASGGEGKDDRSGKVGDAAPATAPAAASATSPAPAPAAAPAPSAAPATAGPATGTT